MPDPAGAPIITAAPNQVAPRPAPTEATLTTEPSPTRVGEVTEASTVDFTAQCYELHASPPFGALVRTHNEDVDILAVVSRVWTGSVEPGRRPLARGQGLSNQADVYRENPELAEILRTEFRAVVVGFRDAGGSYRQHLPAQPARIHGFVYRCSADEVGAFTDELDFLRTLIAGGMDTSADELAAASVREAALARRDADDFRVRAGRELAVLLASDFARLTAVLRRI